MDYILSCSIQFILTYLISYKIRSDGNNIFFLGENSTYIKSRATKVEILWGKEPNHTTSDCLEQSQRANRWATTLPPRLT